MKRIITFQRHCWWAKCSSAPMRPRDRATAHMRVRNGTRSAAVLHLAHFQTIIAVELVVRAVHLSIPLRRLCSQTLLLVSPPHVNITIVSKQHKQQAHQAPKRLRLCVSALSIQMVTRKRKLAQKADPAAPASFRNA